MNQTTSRLNPSVKLFISYAHLNRVWMKRLGVFLNGLQCDNRLHNWGLQHLHAWHDSELTMGNPWDSEIRQALNEMDIFVPLVSPDFFASGYIRDVELPRAEARFNNREILVIPIRIFEMDLSNLCEFLHQFPSLPAPNRCWRSYRAVNNAHKFIYEGLWKAIAQAQKRK